MMSFVHKHLLTTNTTYRAGTEAAKEAGGKGEACLTSQTLTAAARHIFISKAKENYRSDGLKYNLDFRLKGSDELSH